MRWWTDADGVLLYMNDAPAYLDGFEGGTGGGSKVSTCSAMRSRPSSYVPSQEMSCRRTNSPWCEPCGERRTRTWSSSCGTGRGTRHECSCSAAAPWTRTRPSACSGSATRRTAGRPSDATERSSRPTRRLTSSCASRTSGSGKPIPACWSCWEATNGDVIGTALSELKLFSQHDGLTTGLDALRAGERIHKRMTTLQPPHDGGEPTHVLVSARAG